MSVSSYLDLNLFTTEGVINQLIEKTITLVLDVYVLI